MNIKKQILSLILSVSLVSGLSSMGNTDYRRLPKSELVNILLEKDNSLNRSYIEMQSKSFLIETLEHKNFAEKTEVITVVHQDAKKASLSIKIAKKVAIMSAYAVPAITYLYLIHLFDVEPEPAFVPNWADRAIDFLHMGYLAAK